MDVPTLLETTTSICSNYENTDKNVFKQLRYISVFGKYRYFRKAFPITIKTAQAFSNEIFG